MIKKDKTLFSTKRKLNKISIIAALCISGSLLFAQNLSEIGDEKEYKVETRLDTFTRPITFTATKATAINGSISENIITTTQNILNKEAPFLKKGVVKVVGEKEFSAWEMVSDEGGASHYQSAPNPLTYYIAGSSSSLLTQFERAIKIMDLKVDDIKIESKIFFRYVDPMSDNWSGYTDKVILNILIKSDESSNKIKKLKEMAVKAWAIGEALKNETSIDVGIIYNIDKWAGLKASVGSVPSPISRDNGNIITNITEELNLQTMNVEEDLSTQMGNFPNPFIFTEIAIVESANDKSRPYMHKIRAKSLTQNYKTWELYSDDSRGYKGFNKAPTSRSYFTLGTSFCLMSQLTGNKMFYDKKGIDIDDFRVEHQFNYKQDNFMTPSMTGYLDSVVTNVIVTSKAKKELLQKYAKQALSMCFAGEGILNKTQIQTTIYLNDKEIR